MQAGLAGFTFCPFHLKVALAILLWRRLPGTFGSPHEARTGGGFGTTEEKSLRKKNGGWSQPEYTE